MKLILTFLLVVTSLKALTQINLSNGLTACYDLNGNASEAINNLTGTLSSVSPTVGHVSGANTGMYFKGHDSSFIRLPNSPHLKPNKITFSAWVKSDSLSPTQTFIFAKNTSGGFFDAYVMNIRYVSFYSYYKFELGRQDGLNSDLVHSTTTVTTNTWYHVAFCMDNTTMQVYVNGILESSMTPIITNFNYDASRNVILGGTNESHNDPFIGTLDNVWFYKRILSAQEIYALYLQDPYCSASVGIGSQTIDASLIKIYPNPTSGKITINDTTESIKEFEVYDLLGLRILKASFKDSHKTEIDLVNFPNGVYFLKLKNEIASKTIKIVKE